MSEFSHTIVEVGCGDTPFFLSSAPGARKLTEDEQYVGFDLFEEPGSMQRAEHRLAAYTTSRISIRQADACQLPLPDSSADEVIFRNVLGSNQTEPFREQLLIEARRILNNAGTVTVVETYSPFIHPLRDLRSNARRAYLKQTNRGQEHDPSAIELYSSDSRRPTRYIATFTPRRTMSIKTLLSR